MSPRCGGGSPCIAGVFGPTVPGDYWSSGPAYGLNPQYSRVVGFGHADDTSWLHSESGR